MLDVLPGGETFTLTLESLGGAPSSSGQLLTTPPRAPSPVSFDIVDSDHTELCDGQLARDLTIVGYPPCESNGGPIETYAVTLTYTSEDREGQPQVSQRFNIQPVFFKRLRVTLVIKYLAAV
ncbi:uncharacterized protein LOC117644064 [Thrips palmi]|uniref:Uncharacterized protein LOC117644064 n=1 Tax=Thrips palmi TaxID=161013 RepID=A0A6P8YQC2_THRPL|nr:uncharacterized protein LOC117644064 [Thrips palmi]